MSPRSHAQLASRALLALAVSSVAGGALVAVAAPASAAPPGVRIGMATPVSEWSGSLAATGGVDSRRIFDDLGSPDSGVKLATSEVAAGRMPILSFKVPGNDWAGAGSGAYDAQLRALATRLDAINGQVFVTLHHEPTGDGTPAAYAAMMRRALPILGAPSNVDAGPIVNGFWFSKTNMGYTDAEINAWLPANVLSVSEVVASDTYQGGDASAPGENAGVKIRGMSAWASRVGVTRLGIGEYNGVDAASITAAGDAILADRRFVFAAIYNSSVNNREGIDWKLSGDRLTAFKATVAKARAGGGGSAGVVFRDWNGDGNADVLGIDADGDMNLYPGDGAGGFGAMRHVGINWGGKQLVTQAGDWDSNGKPDIVARDGGSLWLYTGDGTGGFASSRQIGMGWDAFSTLVAPGDWTGDGNDDMLAIRADDATMWLYPGNGQGAFLSGRRVGHGWGSISGLTAVGDFDRNGTNDLMARSSAGELRLYPGNRAGGFSAMVAYGKGWSSFTAMTGPGDWTGDGRPDLLARNGTGDLLLYRGNGAGGFNSGSTQVGHGWTSMRILGSTMG